MIKCAVITAGGEGRRMRESGSDVPKPLVKVKEKPLINYLIDALVDNDIDKIIVIEPYFYSLKKELKQSYPNVKFQFYKPRKKQILLKNLLNIKKLINGDFILADSDIIINNLAIKEFINNYHSMNSFASIAAVKKPHFENNHYLEIKNNIIKSFNKNGIENGIHGGFIYSFNKEIFKYLKIYEKQNESSFSKFLNYLIKNELVIANYINDVWDVDDYLDKEKTEQLLSKIIF